MNLFNPLLLGLVMITSQALSVNPDSTKRSAEKITIHITREKDGKKTVIDTSFSSGGDKEIEKFMQDHDIEMSMSKVAGRTKVMKWKDDGTGKEKKMEIVIDGPEPPSPPRPPRAPGELSDEDVQVFSYQFSDEDHEMDIKEMKEKMEREFEFTNKSGKVMRVIDSDDMDSRKKRKSKKMKKRIIIIEEI
ncbi:MAG: hypothetical protein IPM91_21500 [Bacteroidetes bacterium]|jgi:hypothetical protein|nr:hypothetical protein [Bacteroidota bacterium]